MAFSIRANELATSRKRTWYDASGPDSKLTTKKKARHRAIPDSYGNHLIAKEVFESKLNGRELGMQLNFTCEDLYKLMLTPGSHVLVSPVHDVALELSAIIGMNYKGIGRHPVFVVSTTADLKSKLENAGAPLTSDFDDCDSGAVMVAERDARMLKKYISDYEVTDAIVLFDYGVSKTTVEEIIREELKTVRTMVTITSDHVMEIGWHKKYKFPHKAWFANCVKMLNTRHAHMTIADDDTITHRGSKADIASSLTWVWNSKIEALSPPAKKARVGTNRAVKPYRTWIADIYQKVYQTDACPICLEATCKRAVMSCCSAAYCSECVFPWVNAEATCPSCRSEANINTMHVITEADIDPMHVITEASL